MSLNDIYKNLTSGWLRIFTLAALLLGTVLGSACVKEVDEDGRTINADVRLTESGLKGDDASRDVNTRPPAVWSASSSPRGPICTEAAASELDVYVDASESPASELNQQAARNLYRALPAIIAGACVKRLRIFLFAEDGWNPREEKNLQLPTVSVRATSVEDGGEMARLSIGVEEEREKLAADRAVAEDDPRSNYADKLAESLKAVSEGWFLPPHRPAGRPAPRWTDLRGLFHLITETPSSVPKTVLVITDGHHSASTSLGRVIKPENMKLVIILVSEKNRDGYEGYALRRREMLNMCSEAGVIPHSQEDFNFLIPTPPAQRSANQEVSQH